MIMSSSRGFLAAVWIFSELLYFPGCRALHIVSTANHVIQRRAAETEGTPIKFPDSPDSLSSFLQPASEKKGQGVSVKWGDFYSYPSSWPSSPQSISAQNYRPVHFISGSNSHHGNGFPSVWNTGSSSSSNNIANQNTFQGGGSSGFNSGQTGQGFGFQSGSTPGHTSGFQSGSTFGQTSGFQSGHTPGHTSGFQSGSTFGQTSGFQSGHTPGHTSGFQSGQQSNFQSSHSTGFPSSGVSSGFQGSIHQTSAGTAIAGQSNGFAGSLTTAGSGGAFGSFNLGYQRPYPVSSSIGQSSNQQSFSNGLVFPWWQEESIYKPIDTYGPSNSIFTGNNNNFFEGHPEKNDRPINFGYYKGY